MAKELKTIIYIMGYGRSGSTLLDTLLNQHDKAYSVGALNNIYQWIIEKQVCACGDSLERCKFWKEVVNDSGVDAEVSNRLLKLQSSVEGINSFRRLLNGNIDNISAYVEMTERLFKSIANISKSTYIIDSSKSTRDCTGRAFALFAHTNLDIKIIFLIRDVRAVCWSAIKKTGSSERRRLTNIKLINAIRAAVSWWLTNKLALKTIASLPDNAVHIVRYEDLCSSPVNTIEEIGDFIGIDYSSVARNIEAGKEMKVSHNLGGNQIRFNRVLKFMPDMEWKTKMPKFYQLFALLIAGRMNKKIGY